MSAPVRSSSEYDFGTSQQHVSYVLFDATRANDFVLLDKVIKESEDSSVVDEIDKNGCTCLHLCAKLNHFECACVLLKYSANLHLKDNESWWTPLHVSLYCGHFKLSFLFIKHGAVLGRVGSSGSSNSLCAGAGAAGAAPLDREGLTPIGLLSESTHKKNGTKYQHNKTSVMCFGKSDFPLGIATNSGADVVLPKRIEMLSPECIVHIAGSKFHSVAVSKSGAVFSWGYGRGGRLGHGNEAVHPNPTIIQSLLGRARIIHVTASEYHTMALSDHGEVFSWGTDKYGQLGLGGQDSGRVVLSPKRIDSLRDKVAVSIAAGNSHSLCATNDDLLYAWGSNAYGQLGIKSADLSKKNFTFVPKAVNIGISSHSSSRKGSSFSTAASNKGRGMNPLILQIAANGTSSLVLCRSRYTHAQFGIGESGRSSLSNKGRSRSLQYEVNEVLQWGNGVSTPAKVDFRGARKNDSRVCGSGAGSGFPEDDTFLSSNEVVDIVQVAAGTQHFVARCAEGCVYTWGFGAEQLGHSTMSNTVTSTPPSSSSACATISASIPMGAVSSELDGPESSCLSSKSCFHSSAKHYLSHPRVVESLLPQSAASALFGHNNNNKNCHSKNNNDCKNNVTRQNSSDFSSKSSSSSSSSSNDNNNNSSCRSSGRNRARSGSTGSVQDHYHLSLAPSMNGTSPGVRISYISAAGSRTCAVSSTGDLYVWGTAEEKGVVVPGQKSSYQPVAERIAGVKRAVIVSAAEHHTLVLNSYAVPQLPLWEAASSRKVIFANDWHSQSNYTNDEGQNPLHELVEEEEVSMSIVTGIDDYYCNEDHDGDRGTRESLEHSPAFVAPLTSHANERRERHDHYYNDEPPDDDDDEEEDREAVQNSSFLNTKLSSDGYSTTTTTTTTILRTAGLLPHHSSSSSSSSRRNFVPSLKSFCERSVAKDVHIKNALNMFLFADSYDAPRLAEYCSQFIQMNFDAVITQVKPAEVDCLLDSRYVTEEIEAAAAAAILFNGSSLKGILKSSSKAGALSAADLSEIRRNGSYFNSSNNMSARKNVTANSAKTVYSAENSMKVNSGSTVEKMDHSVESLQKQIRSINKKLGTIEELQRKINGTADSSQDGGHSSGGHTASGTGTVPLLTKEQAEKVAQRSSLLIRLSELKQLLLRASAKESRVKLQMDAPSAVTLAVNPSVSTFRKAMDKKGDDEASTVAEGTEEQFSNQLKKLSLTKFDEAGAYSLASEAQKSESVAISKSSTVAAKKSSKRTKFVTLSDFELKALTKKTTTNPSVSSSGSSSSSKCWGVGSGKGTPATTPTTITVARSHTDPFSSSTLNTSNTSTSTSLSILSISSVTASGRSVLSPPSTPPNPSCSGNSSGTFIIAATARNNSNKQAETVVIVGEKTPDVQNTSNTSIKSSIKSALPLNAADGNCNSSFDLASLIATTAPLLQVKKTGQRQKKLDAAAAAAAAATTSAVGAGKSVSPVKSNAWGSSSLTSSAPATHVEVHGTPLSSVVTSASVHSTAGSVSSTPEGKSTNKMSVFAQIQAEEEQSRVASGAVGQRQLTTANATTAAGHSTWFIQRQPKAESLEDVMKREEEEAAFVKLRKQQDKEEKELAAAKLAQQKLKEKQQQHKRPKQPKRQQQQQQQPPPHQQQIQMNQHQDNPPKQQPRSKPEKSQPQKQQQQQRKGQGQA